ncbi:uncharacterized protein LOC130737360 [Lotus japonicus]|uniref:uncharacterized protein LOC130737360 n=1 Tax=Lotus japonicus TaxID=34305 RepID=UPI0025899B7B|nr:uncharacterized protein LOC130737360 [Lotus japonicus]
MKLVGSGRFSGSHFTFLFQTQITKSAESKPLHRRPLQPFFHSHPPRITSVEGMSAFKAYKACAPIAWSPNLYITLVRGIPGTRRLHRRTLEALRLGKCNRTVMRWNTPTVRGMLQQVLTEALHKSIICWKQLISLCPQTEGRSPPSPPLVINHQPAAAAGAS